MESSISLEETNKIRISLGLKPLTEDPDPQSEKDKEDAAKARDKAVKDHEAKKIQDRIAKVRYKRELNASLKGSTLGDADADTDDALKWIKKAKKREKELAKKRQEEQESMDKAFQEEYTERDLAGLKVSHDFEEMGEGEDRILTLKDSRILDNEDDELQNVEMAEAEKTKERNELKIKKRDYTGYDDEEFVEGREGMRRSVLAKYDEFLEGPKETGFRLGASAISTKPSVREEKEQAAAAVNKSLLSIDYAKNLEMTDYLQKGDVGFKKPKTKKKRPSRRVAEDSEVPPQEDLMDVDEKPIVPRERNLDANFVDDDELQAALARSRRAKIKAKKVSPEEIARRSERALFVTLSQDLLTTGLVAEEKVKSEQPDEADVINVDDNEASAGLVFDDTSEFVRGITYDPTAVKKEVKREASVIPTAPGSSKQLGPTPEDDPMEVEELEAGEVVVKEEEDEEAMLNAIESAIAVTEAEEKAAKNGDLGVATSSEQTFSSGMASTLNILRQQGILATPSDDQKDRERVQLQRDLWLAEQRRRLAEREVEKLRSRGANKDQAQREYENRLREQQEARANLEAFKNYKPDVNIVYYDEFGRTLTPKEAWKALSHKFHGKTSGKMKTEKRLKKIAEEKKQEAMASGDTPLSMNKAFQMRQEKTGQAHFVLSVGNRGAVPQATEFLDPQPLAKGKTEKTKGKKKDSSKASLQPLDSAFITLPAAQATYSASASPAPGGEMGSPAPRPGFSRIAAVSESPSGVGSPATGTPVPADRTRVALQLKRKAGDEPRGTPPPKSARR
ncbi:SART-1-domain-containing protein [Auriscalpium vulgare]|uniref:SART-1-domain-containing protein n=1 Tax=Auriscalpium vulgare TaxID=40419 RepID=A0ACB8S0B2_9AGAM|nr:SART-1-domain-containing protein [Auriscalpium vulgare]